MELGKLIQKIIQKYLIRIVTLIENTKEAVKMQLNMITIID